MGATTEAGTNLVLGGVRNGEAATATKDTLHGN
jgi:hypothetical protein